MINIENISRQIEHSGKALFMSYLFQCSKEGWWQYHNDDTVLRLWHKSVAVGAPIDGDTVTLTNRYLSKNNKNTLSLTFDYNAYKNAVLSKYPETIFDHQVVCEGDAFTFRKESGKVTYVHTISNPFAQNKVIMGAYAVIKNSTGEFIEFVNAEDLAKMKAASNMKTIWDAWADRMALKSVIKRICKVNFRDVTKDIDKVDNESYDLSQVPTTTFDETAFADVEAAETYGALIAHWRKCDPLVKDKAKLKELVMEKRKKLTLNETHENWEQVCKQVADGEITIEVLKSKYFISEETKQKITDYAAKNL